MRHLLSIAALAILPLTAVAQTQNAPTPQPGKMSLPTGSLYRGGFSSPVFQGGFAHPIYPNGFPRMATGSGPGHAIRSSKGPIPRAEPRIQAAADTAMARQPDASVGSRAAAADMFMQQSHSADMPMSTPAATSAPLPMSSPGEGRGADVPASAPTQDVSGATTRAEVLSRIAQAQAPPPPPVNKCCHSRATAIANAPRDMHVLATDRHLVAAEDRSTPSSRPEMHMADTVAAPKADPHDAMVGTAPASATESLQEHLKSEPDDFHAMRLLAISLLSTKHSQEAAQTMAKAYQSDPLLAKEPIDLKAAGFEGARVVALVKAAEDAARQSKSSATWLLAAVLHQAKGSQAQALAALDNARRNGLNADVSDWLAAELKKSPERVAQAASK